MTRRIKNFIHKHENLEKLVLSARGLFCILRAKFIFRKIEHNSPKGNLKVLILGVRTLPTTNLVYFDAIFGHAFKKLGSEVRMLYCDGVLNSCDADTVFRNQRPQCFVCKKLGGFLKSSLNLDCASYRQYITSTDIEEIKKIVANLDDKELSGYEYLGVNAGKHALASAIRYFLFGKLDLNDPDQIALLREKLIYAMITTKVAENFVVKEKPNVIFCLHGIYSTWGPFLDYFRLKKIDTLVYINMFEIFGHFMFKRNSKLFDSVSKEKWLDFCRSPLTKDEEAKIDAYFAKRFEGNTDDHKLYEEQFNSGSEEDLSLKALLKEKHPRRYVMYPNLAWDGAVEEDVSEIFDNIFSWIDRTIEFFKQKKDYQLIIKPHPAELIWEGCSKTLTDHIREQHGSLPENIILLKPDVSLRAYDLVGPDTVGIVFNGGLGLELAFAGIPVLVAADSHYRDAGIVYKVKTLEEYLSLLDFPEPLISFAKDNHELAKKYAYFYFFKGMIRIPFYRNDKWSTIDWKVVRDTEKLLADSSPIIKICKKVMNKEDIVAPL